MLLFFLFFSSIVRYSVLLRVAIFTNCPWLTDELIRPVSNCTGVTAGTAGTEKIIFRLVTSNAAVTAGTACTEKLPWPVGNPAAGTKGTAGTDNHIQTVSSHAAGTEGTAGTDKHI